MNQSIMEHTKNLNEQGYTVASQFFDQSFVNRLINDLDSLIIFNKP